MNIEFGTVTLLFTDIEGSTRLWEADPQAMATALRRHDQILRDTCVAHGGDVFKTIGDAFCVAFATAPAAAIAGIEAQRALSAESWPDTTPIKVRMAVHTGAVEARDADYFGPPLNRVARLLATAHGGQTVVSEGAFILIRDALPPGANCRPLGEHRLRDLGRPEAVFQLTHDSLPHEFPPLRSLDNPEMPNNLPQQVTSFVGREREVAEINSMLGETRILTLLGPGGAGKSRLALQVAAERLDRYPEGVWFIELAGIADPTLVAATALRTVGGQESSEAAADVALANYLGSKRLMLVLDNCEHLIEAAAAVADRIARECPNVTLLATSREALAVQGERTYRVPALTTPDPSQTSTPQTLSQYESVRLFIDRARLHAAEFAVTDENAPALASVCHRLDGIPMAIELAAARVRSMTVEEIDRRLDQRFRLLVGGPRTTTPRQQTLRALIDWSYDLLSPAERALLGRLSVFAGGWTLEAAEFVCAGDGVDGWEVLDLLTSMCDKSLVLATSEGNATRYRLLETVRQYASDRLEEAGQTGVFTTRHLEWCLDFASRAAVQFRSPEAVAWLAAVEREHDNLRTAIRVASEAGVDAEIGLRLCADLWRFWFFRAYFNEGMAHLRAALGRAEAVSVSEASAEALYGGGALAHGQLDLADAKRYLTSSSALFQQMGLESRAAKSLSLLGATFVEAGDYDQGAEYLERALATARSAGDRDGLGPCLVNLGFCCRCLGNFVRARELFLEAWELNIDGRDVQGIAVTETQLGIVALEEGDIGAARSYFQSSLHRWRQLGAEVGITWVFLHLARLASVNGADEAAQTLLGVNERILTERSTGYDHDEQARYELLDARCRAALGAEPSENARRVGRAMSLDEAVAFALEI